MSASDYGVIVAGIVTFALLYIILRTPEAMRPPGTHGKASRRRRFLARAREAASWVLRRTPAPPPDGDPLDERELFELAELTLSWESGATRPDPVIPEEK